MLDTLLMNPMFAILVVGGITAAICLYLVLREKS